MHTGNHNSSHFFLILGQAQSTFRLSPDYVGQSGLRYHSGTLRTEKPITRSSSTAHNGALCSSSSVCIKPLRFCPRYWFTPKSVKKRHENMQAFRQFLAAGHCSPVLRIGVRVLSTSDSASLKKNVASILDSLSLKPGTPQFFVCLLRKRGKI